MTRIIRTFLVAVAAMCATANAPAATITPIVSPSEFVSITLANDFEVGAAKSPPPVAPPFSFESTAQIGLASAWTGKVTHSGVQGLVESAGDNPLRIDFDAPVREVGMYFGNDDFGRVFNVKLELFDASNASLGAVQVRSNGNDFADQFIGARSQLVAAAIEVSYQQPNAQLLSVYIDDLMVGPGIVVPEPTSAAIAVLGVAAMALCLKTRRTILPRR